MSTEPDHTREIAQRVARRVAGEIPAKARNASPKPEVISELAAVRASLSELQRKIAQLEAKVSSESSEPAAGATDYFVPERAPLDSIRPNAQAFDTGARAFDQRARPAPLTHSPWLAGVNASNSHPSQEKFGVEEAVVSELVDFFEKEKTCNVEPGGKPCDHCAMCSSRGF
ncbi:MAG TPA: hypothetical protein VGO73_11745 [Pyrinomonadaceae bacterium]|nr:hypothetical protein [Pyrinomonadaceae bacterium]